MDIKKIQVDLSYYTKRQQREIMMLIADNEQEVDFKNYQDLFIFRYCDEYDMFRLFEEPIEGLIDLTREMVYEHFKETAVRYKSITEKDYNTLLKHHKEIGKILDKFKVRRSWY